MAVMARETWTDEQRAMVLGCIGIIASILAAQL
jgi:hypothetical protein